MKLRAEEIYRRIQRHQRFLRTVVERFLSAQFSAPFLGLPYHFQALLAVHIAFLTADYVHQIRIFRFEQRSHMFGSICHISDTYNPSESLHKTLLHGCYRLRFLFCRIVWGSLFSKRFVDSGALTLETVKYTQQIKIDGVHANSVNSFSKNHTASNTITDVCFPYVCNLKRSLLNFWIFWDFWSSVPEFLGFRKFCFCKVLEKKQFWKK